MAVSFSMSIFPKILVTWDIFVRSCLGVPEFTSPYQNDLLGLNMWAANCGGASHTVVVSYRLVCVIC